MLFLITKPKIQEISSLRSRKLKHMDRLSLKLAVILHADVVGSTSLVQKNETLAHERIQAVFHKFSEAINSYGGFTRELRGDALVAEFEKASDAVAASLAFQTLNQGFNATLSDDIRPELRVGISMGEVVIADNTITGAGVVLAQRLEQLADSGGVVVQSAVSETVPARMPYDFESLGEQILKGFDQPVRAFSVKLRSGEQLPTPESRSTGHNNPLFPAKLSRDSYEALTGERLELPNKPSIAVLPFQNMSGDPEQEFFADGMSEDIITALSRLPNLVVIARNSTFVYKGRAINIREVGCDLGVSHVLEGSIRKSGNRLRITAQLIDTRNGDHVWAERYDRNLDDIFAVQDEITHNIVIELQVKLVRGEAANLFITDTSSVKAWEHAMRAAPLVDSHVRDNVTDARQLLKQALELDQNYSNAWVLMGWLYWEESVWNWCGDTDEAMQKALDSAQKALAIDPNFPMAYSLLANIHMVLGEAELSITMAEKAVELAPNNSLAQAFLGNVLMDSGRIKEGIHKMKKAIRLCPFPIPWYLMVFGAGYHLNGDNDAAIIALNQAIQREPESHLPRVWLASTLAETGRFDEAKTVSKQVLDIAPNFSALQWAKSFKSKSHERLKDNLLAAGLPE
ncbi:MAG: adenylate cyclase [Gammaproteobacteria bacterium]|jgi:adenylate cyclase